jgi:ABC-type uncharacterized transport system YnjBCD ATPase subunit
VYCYIATLLLAAIVSQARMACIDSPHFSRVPHCVRDQIKDLPFNFFELLYTEILIPTNIDQDLYASIEL